MPTPSSVSAMGAPRSSTASKGPSSAIQRLMARRSASRSGGNRWFTSRGRMSPAYTFTPCLCSASAMVRAAAAYWSTVISSSSGAPPVPGVPQIVGAESEHRVGEALDGKQVVAVALDARVAVHAPGGGGCAVEQAVGRRCRGCTRSPRRGNARTGAP